MQLREQTNQHQHNTQEVDSGLSAIPQVTVPDPQTSSPPPSRPIPVDDVDECVPQLQPFESQQRLLLDWNGMVIVATLISSDRHILILSAKQMTPAIGARVNIREAGSINGYSQHLQIPWLVHNHEARVNHEGAYTRLTLIR